MSGRAGYHLAELNVGRFGAPTDGHRPTLDEALERLAHLRDHGDGERAFGWSYLADTRLGRDHACTGAVAV